MTQTKTEMDVIDLLVHQHSMIRDLFAEVLEHSGEQRRESFRRLVQLLAVHETAEEEIVHPVSRRSLPGGEGIVDDRLAEEREAKELLSELDGMDIHDPQFLPKLDKLRVSVLTHARAEERYEFYRLKDEFSDTQRRAMAAAVRAAEATAPTHPHPGVESATANLAVGPVASVIDRVRDIIRST
ncbi:Hemerythrin HHE cation binding domain-containing protein [Thermomonospora echinospora]|uniref:Hemerythrin HHE cation binding domain-containing protein n=1 Tax=Thermomonospora echinospora TaxID=1992 RepID=A0A1H6DUL9_9ACTN|nr:hemerythrin domain-containing protein [Thermomonospora echinospora]SEG89047.1 Hemerythrin HHE cation binding domain-containing protein [Thermomonospora echinospora]